MFSTPLRAGEGSVRVVLTVQAWLRAQGWPGGGGGSRWCPPGSVVELHRPRERWSEYRGPLVVAGFWSLWVRALCWECLPPRSSIVSCSGQGPLLSPTLGRGNPQDATCVTDRPFQKLIQPHTPCGISHEEAFTFFL